jgi:hypothetical protein
MELSELVDVARQVATVNNARITSRRPHDPIGWLPVEADTFGGTRTIGWVHEGENGVEWTANLPEYEPAASLDAALENLVHARQAHSVGIRVLDYLDGNSGE